MRGKPMEAHLGVVQGLQEVTLLWNSVGLWRVGASGASTSG